MSDSRSLIERFYDRIWNCRDYAVADEILVTGFRFRGSLGSETVGIPAFLAYVDSIHIALEGYRCIIEELVVNLGPRDRGLPVHSPDSAVPCPYGRPLHLLV